MFESKDQELIKLLDGVEYGLTQIPDFQRDWVWDNDRIKMLLASLTCSYPIGAIMLLESGGDLKFECRYVEGVKLEKKVSPELMILDGQQRLTSMYLSLRSSRAVSTCDAKDKNKKLKRFYYLDIRKALDTSTDRADAIVAVDENKQQRSNIGRDVVLDLSTPELEYKNRMIPFNKLSSRKDINVWRNKYQEYYKYDSDIVREYQKIDDSIIQPLLNYRLPVIKIYKTAPKEAVCQVFENVNRGGVSLTVFELLTATYAASGYRLRDVWDTISNSFKQEKSNLLEAMDQVSFLTSMTLLSTSLKGATVTAKKRDVLNLSLDDFKNNVSLLIGGCHRAEYLMVDMNIFSRSEIPYKTQLIPLSVICALLGKKCDNITVKDKIKQWFWCGVFGELYGGANETRYALDVQQVVEWCNDEGGLPKTINDCNFSAMRLFELSTKNSAAYKGMIGLILGNGAKDWISGGSMSLSNYLDRKADIHHIFPQNYCSVHHYNKVLWNSIINKTPIFAGTNRYIGGVAPSEYIDKVIRNKHLGQDKMAEFVCSHLVNFDKLLADDFYGFIVDRANRLLDGVERLTGKPIADRESDEVTKKFNDILTLR